MNFPNQSCDPELLRLMYGALDAAWDQQQRSWDDIAARARRTAMAFQIMTGVSAGERDPERLKLAALNAHGRPYPWTLQRRTNFKRRSALTNLACNRCTLYVPAVHRRSFMAEHYIGFAHAHAARGDVRWTSLAWEELTLARRAMLHRPKNNTSRSKLSRKGAWPPDALQCILRQVRSGILATQLRRKARSCLFSKSN